MHRRLISAVLLTAAATLTATATSAPPAQAHPVIDPAAFQQVTLAKGVAEMGEPMSLAVLPDRSVLHTARSGTLRRTDAAGNTAVVANIGVYSHDEEGLQGVGVDPNFASNRYIYLYYAPPLSTPAGDAPTTGTDFSAWRGVNRLSRFTVTAGWQLQAGSEVTVIDVPADRGLCCHVGGDIDFDAAGNLYLSTGDDTNPFESDGYAPIDERANRNPAFDAQRSAGNTNDLRGKILRIKPSAGGGYTVPGGNLFAPGTANTRPEIYAMGFRNPFRLSVDKATGVVYVGDYGPDAGTASARGPAGQVEFARVAAPGNFGWPYCTGANTAADTYAEYDFATGAIGAKYNCSGGPTNNSRNNTGLGTLPPAQPAWIPYDNCSVAAFGCGSESPMGGPVYRYNASSTSSVKFPADFDGHVFLGEFGRRWIRVAHATAATPTEIAAFPWSGTQVMDLAFGPDGALYVLDYGTGYFNGDANSALYRIEYIAGGPRSPIAAASGTPTSGQAPLTVAFSSAGSSDPEGGALTYSWTFGDGGTSTAANPSHTYTSNGNFTATLTVRDPQNLTATASVPVTVGNTAPKVTLLTPLDGQLFSFGDTVPFQVQVTDPEDASIDCSRVKVTYLLGHDSHAHSITSANGCNGSIAVPVDGEHDAAANIFGVFDAEYTDNGGATTHTQNVTQPRTRQGEHFSASQGVTVFDKAAAHGGRAVGDIHNGDWIAFDRYNVSTATGFTARVASAGVGGTLTLRAGSPTGQVIGTATVSPTGGWETFVTVNGVLAAAPSGTVRLYLVFTGGTGALFDLDDFTFTTGVPGRVTGIGGKCMDIAGANTADGTQVQLWTCNNTSAQSWTRTGQTIRALGKCLDISGGATANGTKVQVWTCNNSGAQNWVVESGGAVRNPQSNRCLEAPGGQTGDGTPLRIWDCNAGTNQRWTFS
jgi:glucose/arabinose dehydrogenase/PKD repeat protein